MSLQNHDESEAAGKDADESVQSHFDFENKHDDFPFCFLFPFGEFISLRRMVYILLISLWHKGFILEMNFLQIRYFPCKSFISLTASPQIQCKQWLSIYIIIYKYFYNIYSVIHC